jgi:hypothetical protein
MQQAQPRREAARSAVGNIVMSGASCERAAG